ncbi:class I SAM-dependent methyltransferase [Paenibacillus sp. SC116]|uniref:class I SAM-dependent methyltransferase n=1 Tax=Paenibacillus sp. SC116 TaxID=2968986 RepID=UPI00215A1EC1|nr:class I SAM-dependent methyltransferase [Paenibacillus sp. SC116]MCR8843493.1 class I SAM-dependent methyltransferase [Paenibacillus sp. SC116]
MRIDLGCGRNKHSHCIGIDKHPYADVDLVHDLNDGVPFPSNHVQFVMASHLLQYVNDLTYIMREIYRVSQDRALVCLVVPYAHVSSHLTHPHYLHLFNEHSARHWSPYSNSMLDEEDFIHPLSENWSLLLSNGEITSEESMDLRLLRMEYFYFPEYQCLYDEVELRRLRQSQMNVAYQLMLHLLVIKSPIQERELREWSHRELEEPQSVTEQRQAVKKHAVEAERPFEVDIDLRKVQNKKDQITWQEELRVDEQSTKQKVGHQAEQTGKSATAPGSSLENAHSTKRQAASNRRVTVRSGRKQSRTKRNTRTRVNKSRRK